VMKIIVNTIICFICFSIKAFYNNQSI
jgi:hypothetical protein